MLQECKNVNLRTLLCNKEFLQKAGVHNYVYDKLIGNPQRQFSAKC